MNKENDNLKNPDNNAIQISSEILRCKLCKCSKDKSNFYKYTKNVEGRVLYEQYIDYICKECLPIEALYWPNGETHPKINQSILIKHFQKLQIDKFEKETGLIFNELISNTEAEKILELSGSHNRFIEDKVKMKIIKQYKIYYRPVNFIKNEKMSKNCYQLYYTKQDIDLLKFIKDNGFLIIRGQKSIEQAKIGIHNPPYQFIRDDGKQYLLVNIKDKKKTCVVCSEYKDFDFYHKGGNPKIGHSNVCKDCTTIQSKEYYDNLDLEKKKTLFKQIKEWSRNNKVKISLYRKLNRKKPTIKQRIMRNLRKRINDLIQSRGYEFAYVFNTKELIKDKSIPWFGCTYEEFMNYIESKFLPCDFVNYGSGFLTDKSVKLIKDENGNVIKIPQWQIDHIKPVHSFNLSIKEERLKLNHYTNLLPMWLDDNNWKQGKVELCPVFDKDFLEKYKELEILIKKDKNDNNSIKEM